MGGLLRFPARIFLLLALAMTAPAADVSGRWSGTLARLDANGNPGDANPFLLVLKQSSTVVAGTAGPDQNQQWPVQNGKIDGNKISLQVTATDGTFYLVVATVDGDAISGGVTVMRGGQSWKAKIDLRRSGAN